MLQRQTAEQLKASQQRSDAALLFPKKSGINVRELCSRVDEWLKQDNESCSGDSEATEKGHEFKPTVEHAKQEVVDVQKYI